MQFNLGENDFKSPTIYTNCRSESQSIHVPHRLQRRIKTNRKSRIKREISMRTLNYHPHRSSCRRKRNSARGRIEAKPPGAAEVDAISSYGETRRQLWVSRFGDSNLEAGGKAIEEPPPQWKQQPSIPTLEPHAPRRLGSNTLHSGSFHIGGRKYVWCEERTRISEHPNAAFSSMVLRWLL